MKTLRWIDRAVCLGNGKSRIGLDLVKMKDYATVIGCNAIYRDFQCDILVALDSRMSHEVYRSGYAHRAICYDYEGVLDCVCILQHEQDERS